MEPAMRSRLVVLASGLALMAATPALALTVSSAPPSRDVAQRLNQAGASLPAARDAWGGGRPQAGASFSSSTTTPSGTSSSFDFGSVRGTVYSTPGSAWTTDRRDTSSQNPLALTPPRR
jgi:hypothetical protein